VDHRNAVVHRGAEVTSSDARAIAVSWEAVNEYAPLVPALPGTRSGPTIDKGSHASRTGLRIVTVVMNSPDNTNHSNPQSCQYSVPIHTHAAGKRTFTAYERPVDRVGARTRWHRELSAARACGIRDSRAWQTTPLMLTRQVEPAAFLDNPRVPFVRLAPAMLER
jgi:hypothetical protein